MKLCSVLIGFSLWVSSGSAFTPKAFLPPAQLQVPSAKHRKNLISYATIPQKDEEAVTKKDNDAAILKDLVGGSPKIGMDPVPYSEITIGVLKETQKGENRVSQTPDSVRSLVKAGFTVAVQEGGMFLFVVTSDIASTRLWFTKTPKRLSASLAPLLTYPVFL